MKRIEEWLKKHPLIGLDTPIFIYHLEDHPRYAPLTDALFDSLEKGTVRGITSYWDVEVAVGTSVTWHPPHRSVLEELPHTALALGNNAKAN